MPPSAAIIKFRALFGSPPVYSMQYLTLSDLSFQNLDFMRPASPTLKDSVRPELRLFAEDKQEIKK
jgi:hypothetical protein